jgi:16S rRNA processing protein RimM
VTGQGGRTLADQASPPADQASPPAEGGRLVVGLVRGAQGLRGVLRVEVLTDDERRFEPGSILHLEGSAAPLTVRSAHAHGPGLLVSFAEVTDRNTAEDMLNHYLEGDQSAGEPLPEGAYYWHELVGCQVVTTSGEVLGTVEDVFRVAEAEVYVVKGPRGEILVPAVADVVRELAPGDRRIVVDADVLGLDS